MNRFVFIATASLFCFLPSAGSALEFSGSIVTADELLSETFNAPVSQIQVDAFNGYIETQATLEKNIRVEIIKRGAGATQEEARQDLKNIDVTLRPQGSRLVIRAQRTDQRDVPNSGAMVKLWVPVKTQLQLHTSNDVITLNGALGDVLAETSNAEITASGTTGRLSLLTSNGEVHVQGGKDALTIKTSNADVDIVADHVLLSVETSNGKVTFSGTPAKGKHVLTTSCGDMCLTLPTSLAFKFSAETSNGAVTTAFPLTSTQASEETCLKGTVGRDSGIALTLQTSNGDIQLAKK